jgi:hypothetical protein
MSVKFTKGQHVRIVLIKDVTDQPIYPKATQHVGKIGTIISSSSFAMSDFYRPTPDLDLRKVPKKEYQYYNLRLEDKSELIGVPEDALELITTER